MEGFTQAIGEKEENFVLVDRVEAIARIIAIDREIKFSTKSSYR